MKKVHKTSDRNNGGMLLGKRKLLSFCITCKNRLTQLQKTLRKNLDDNALDRGDIEFVLVDFDTPGMRAFVEHTCHDELHDGYLKYYHTTEVPYWSAPLCKNTSHALARGQVLVNLDVDNYTGERGGRLVLDVFNKYGMDILFHQKKPITPRSTYGRIALSSSTFRALGGYDEQLMPVGFQDNDLILRFLNKWPQRRLVEYAPPSSAASQANGGGGGSCVVARQRIQIPLPPADCLKFVPQSDADKMANIDPKYARMQLERKMSDTEFKRWMVGQNIQLAKTNKHNGAFVSNVRQAHLGVHPLQIQEPLAPRKTFYLRLVDTSSLCSRLRTLLTYAFAAHRAGPTGHVFFEWAPSESCPGRFEDCFAPVPRCTQLSPAEFEKRLPKGLLGKLARSQEVAAACTVDDTPIVVLSGSTSFAAMQQCYGFMATDSQVCAKYMCDRLRLAPALAHLKTKFMTRYRQLDGFLGVYAPTTTSASTMSATALVEAMRARIATSPKQRFFLVAASSDLDTQRLVQQQFPRRVLAYPSLGKLHITALQHAALELMLLAECTEVIGVRNSSSLSGMLPLLRTTVVTKHGCHHPTFANPNPIFTEEQDTGTSIDRHQPNKTRTGQKQSLLHDTKHDTTTNKSGHNAHPCNDVRTTARAIISSRHGSQSTTAASAAGSGGGSSGSQPSRVMKKVTTVTTTYYH